jgi:hypothetical protein
MGYGGRPRKKIDEELIKKLARLNCTMIEIGSVVGCSVDTLERRFADIIKTEREIGKSSLRRWQWAAAEKGNTAMLIWLGKQWLGQTDKVQNEIKAPEPTVVTLFGNKGQMVLGTSDKVVEKDKKKDESNS